MVLFLQYSFGSSGVYNIQTFLHSPSSKSGISPLCFWYFLRGLNMLNIESTYKLHLLVLARKVENLIPCKTCTYVYRSFIFNCQTLEGTSMSFNTWLEKYTVVYPNNGLSSSSFKTVKPVSMIMYMSYIWRTYRKWTLK